MSGDHSGRPTQTKGEHMPRVSILTNREDMGAPNFSGENECVDICKTCWRGVDADEVAEAEGLPLEMVEAAFAEADLSSGEEHPPYEECEYDCALCREPLTGRDD